VTPGSSPTPDRGEVTREGVAVGAAVGALGISFGALATASGFTILQTCAMSVLIFTGGSQFALVGVIAAGGGAASAVATGALLGLRNALYGVRLAPLLQLRRRRRIVAAQLVIDESTAVAVAAGDDDALARWGFWVTGVAVFVAWNIFTLLGALLGSSVGDVGRWGLDAAVPAAFLALLWPRLSDRRALAVAIGSGFVAIAATPWLRPGLPVLLAATVALAAALPDPERTR
jgi:predicted branched-subunit amino acid permease